MASIQQVRYSQSPKQTPLWGAGLTGAMGGVNQFLQNKKDKEALKQKNLMALLPVAMQMKMTKPGGKTGDPGVVNTPFGNITFTGAAKDWGEKIQEQTYRKNKIMFGDEAKPQAMVDAEAHEAGLKAKSQALRLDFSEDEAQQHYWSIVNQRRKGDPLPDIDITDKKYDALLKKAKKNGQIIVQDPDSGRVGFAEPGEADDYIKLWSANPEVQESVFGGIFNKKQPTPSPAASSFKPGRTEDQPIAPGSFLTKGMLLNSMRRRALTGEATQDPTPGQPAFLGGSLGQGMKYGLGANANFTDVPPHLQRQGIPSYLQQY